MTSTDDFAFSVPNPEDRTLGALVAAAASRQSPSRVWLRFGEDLCLSAQQVHVETNRLAQGLAEMGVTKGDRVAAMCANGWPLVAVWIACAKLGAMFVPLNIHYRGDILAHALEVCDPRLLFVDEQHVTTVENVESDVSTVVIPSLLEIRDVPTATQLAFGKLRTGRTTPPEVDLDPSDPQVIVFTSGTTGPSKGVLVSHQQEYTYADIVGQACGLNSDDVYLTCLPLFHVNALLTVTSGLLFDNEVVVYPAFSASGFWGWVKSSGATVVSFFGSMPHILLKERKWPPGGTSLRACWLFPSSAELARDLSTNLGGVATYTAYASTESNFVTIGGSSIGTPMDTVGRPHPLLEVKIVDPASGQDLPAGKRGEIRTRARHDNVTMLGYFGMPEATEAAFDDGWYRTGDVGFVDADGYLHFVDRLSDSIRRNGENISSMEVETIIMGHASVLECAVVGVPGAMAEQEVMAVIVLSSGAEEPTPAELTVWAKERMPYFMVPQGWVVMPELPKTANGKVRKGELRSLRP